MRLIFLLSILLLSGCKTEETTATNEFPTPFETSSGTQSATYEEVIDYYFDLARAFPSIHIQTMGETDSGQPLHLVSFNPDAEFNFQKLRQDKIVLLINNGIHPGEPDGIDATMMLFRDYATGKTTLPEGIALATIPVYNIGGSLNRNSDSRANQNGPQAYGFRGNARNYDLNRDFIKADTRNAQSFAQVFHQVKPDFFIDNHVSNGADYQYTLTHLFTQSDKLGGDLGEYLRQALIPGLERRLEQADWQITPYVNVHGRPPDQGFTQFMDHPRYSTGYTALWNVPGLMVETHMLKPYAQRVEGTRVLMEELIQLLAAERKSLREHRELAFKRYAAGDHYPIAWEVDSTQVAPLQFHGYEADTVTSEVTGADRLSYRQDLPYTRNIPYYNRFRAADSVVIPRAYVIPVGYRHLGDHLERNGIQYRRMEKDTSLQVAVSYIEDYQTYPAPYEGHYPHYNTRVEVRQETVTLRPGDLYVPTAQPGLRYLVETLEPAAHDSFFNWNFFDTILGRKEGFSSYVFEDTAARMMRESGSLGREFQDRIAADSAFAASPGEQLRWWYERSAHAEEAYLRYPVYRVMDTAQ